MKLKFLPNKNETLTNTFTRFNLSSLEKLWKD